MHLLTRTAPRALSRRGLSLQQQSQHQSGCLSTARPPPSSSDFVHIIEVGPRDGLQNEKRTISKDVKLELIRRLARTGLQTIEAGSFVSPKWVPQMAASDDIMRALLAAPPAVAAGGDSMVYQWLLPNMRGYDTFDALYKPGTASADNDHGPSLNTSSDDPNAMPSTAGPAVSADNDHGPALNTSSDDPNAMPSTPGPAQHSSATAPDPTHEISIFLAATESFSRTNTNATIAESIARLTPLFARAARASVPVRAYISVALGCPFEGAVSPTAVADLASTLLSLGAAQISVADTTGQGNAATTRTLLRALASAGVRNEHLALHLHDTYGQALANTLVGLDHGVRCFDGAVAGLGGCPFSPGATGNVATEDLVYTLHALGLRTGVDLEAVSEVGEWISAQVGRGNESRAGKATLARRRKAAAAAA